MSAPEGSQPIAVATLNTRGTPLAGSQLGERYRLIADAFEASAIDVVNFQEVVTYQHLRLLTRRMPSFRYVSYRPALPGPAGGVVTASRQPVAERRYERFPVPPATAGFSPLFRLRGALKGTLVTRLAQPGLCVVNTHPLANVDGDWSPASRFYPVHQAQLASLARVVRALPSPSVVCGDFNVTRDSTLHRDFLLDTGLVDAFEGHVRRRFTSSTFPQAARPAVSTSSWSRIQSRRTTHGCSSPIRCPSA